jgi:osmotically-inducible protein OsmY
MKTAVAALLAMMVVAGRADAQVQSTAPGDQAVTQKVSLALVQAGIDPRTTSVKVLTTADHTIYLSGLISNAQTVKLAETAARKAAPSYRVINNIHSSFFGDQNHVTGDKVH